MEDGVKFSQMPKVTSLNDSTTIAGLNNGQNVQVPASLLKGQTGPQGIQGERGLQGQQGLQGEKGEPGEAGQDGFSPVVNITSADGKTTISVENEDGTESVELNEFSDEEKQKLDGMVDIKGIGDNLELAEDGTLNAKGGAESNVNLLSTYSDSVEINDAYNAAYLNARLNSPQIVIGEGASGPTGGYREIIIGRNASSGASSQVPIAIGDGAAVGNTQGGIAIGYLAKDMGSGSISIGRDTGIDGPYINSVALGSYAKCRRAKEVSVGNEGSSAVPTRYIANVTAGELPFDAVNVQQLADAIAGVNNQFQTEIANYYTKTETDQMVSAIPKFAIEVVDTLPTENISSTTIYLVPSNTEGPDVYTEYIYVNSQWEKLGVQTVDLTNYFTKTEINTLLADYYTKTEVGNTFVAKDDIVQELGTSDTAVMSQAAVNAIVGDIQTILESI